MVVEVSGPAQGCAVVRGELAGRVDDLGGGVGAELDEESHDVEVADQGGDVQR